MPLLHDTTKQEYLMAVRGREVRYFPVGKETSELVAKSFDKQGAPALVAGFSVYDTTVSTSYAVAIYPTLGEARDHAAHKVPAKPAGLEA